MKQFNPEKLKHNIEGQIYGEMERQNISGTSVLVYQKDKTIYKKHFGTMGPDSDIPVTDLTQYRIASMTKPITGTAIMMMVEAGKLHLDDLVEDYLPQFKNRYVARMNENGEAVVDHPAKTPMKIRHLLCHTSGLGSGPAGRFYLNRMTLEDRSTLDHAIQYYAEKTALDFDPFSTRAYSGVAAFDVLGKIVELISGKSYDVFLQENILEPLEMSHTTFQPTETQWKNLIAMHGNVDGKGVRLPQNKGCVFTNVPVTHFLGGAGLISTLDDYSHFAEMLLNEGIYKDRRLLKPESVKEMRTPQFHEELESGHQKWGLSMRIVTDDAYGRLPSGCFGWSGAFGTHFWIDPANQSFTIFMRNTGLAINDQITSQFEQNITDAME